MFSPALPSNNLGLLRHGQTVWNREKRIQGSGNSPLTAKGITSCRAWGTLLSKSSWNRIIVSPLQRTQHTAELVNESLQLPIEIDTQIREQNWGAWEGLTLDQVKSTYPGALETLVQCGWEFRPPEGESRKELLDRVLTSLKGHCKHRPGENFLLITHLGVIKSLLYFIEGRDYLPEEPKIVHNNRFHTICYRDETFSILESNLTLPEKS